MIKADLILKIYGSAYIVSNKDEIMNSKIDPSEVSVKSLHPPVQPKRKCSDDKPHQDRSNSIIIELLLLSLVVCQSALLCLKDGHFLMLFMVSCSVMIISGISHTRILISSFHHCITSEDLLPLADVYLQLHVKKQQVI